MGCIHIFTFLFWWEEAGGREGERGIFLSGEEAFHAKARRPRFRDRGLRETKKKKGRKKDMRSREVGMG